jgi:ribosome-binding factor A
MAYRAEKLAQELKEKLSVLIARELRDPRIGLATITNVKLSPDRRYARLFVSVLGSTEEQRQTLTALNDSAGFLRRQIGARIRLRHIPELIFVFDGSIEYGARMEQILEEVKRELPDLPAPDESPEKSPDEEKDSDHPGR